MNKRVSSFESMTGGSASKKMRDDLLHDDPIDGDNELGENDSASQISMPPSVTTEFAAAKQMPPPPPTQMDSFRNVFRAVMMNNGVGAAATSSGDASASQTDQLRSLNDKLKPVTTENVNLELIENLSKRFDEVPVSRLILSDKRKLQCWMILSTLKPPSHVFDTDNANFAVVETLYKEMMDTYAKAEKYFTEQEDLPEELEIELHLTASKYFKCLLLFNNTIQPKHLKAMLAGRSFVLFETISPNLQHLLKSSLNFQLNENFDQTREIDRKNPIFKMDGWGIILVRPRNDRFFELQPDCAEYMSDIFRSICSQRIKEDNGSTSRETINQVWFNLVNRKNVPSIPALDNSKLKKLDKELQLCHVTINDAYMVPSKNGQLIMVVVLYVNYFLNTGLV